MKYIRSVLTMIAPLLAALLCSCAHIEAEPRQPPLEMPPNFSASGAAEVQQRWWRSFGDEKLTLLVEEALAGNPGLSQALARLRQAQALARQAGAAKVPDISVEGNAARARNIVRSGIAEPSASTANQFGLGLAAAYEVDLWGRIGATERAAVRDAEASRYDLESATTTLIAQVVNIWYALGSLNSQSELIRKQVESSARQLELIELRFRTGQANALDVLQQRGQLAALKALVPQIESSLATTRSRLAVLLGRPPRSNQDLEGEVVTELPPLPNAGVPADLIVNRPDLQSSLARVQAADERVAAAIANRFPALRISASAGYSARETAELFDDWIWSLAGNLIAPLIDGGSRRAESERAAAVVAERIEAYAETALNAIREVEDALVAERKQSELIEKREQQLGIARETLHQALSRYRSGLSDYLSVLRAIESRQSLQRGLIESRQQLLEYRVQLYRALGGDYEESLQTIMKSTENRK